MQCPFCGAEMEKGFIYGRRDIGLLWLPQGEKLPPMLTENAVDKRHGLLLGKRPFPELTKLDYHVCRKCSTGVSRF